MKEHEKERVPGESADRRSKDDWRRGKEWFPFFAPKGEWEGDLG